MLTLGKKKRTWHKSCRAPHDKFSPTKKYADGRQKNGAFGSSPWGFGDIQKEVNARNDNWFQRLRKGTALA